MKTMENKNKSGVSAFKRNAVAITVLLFVCAAVYLNWSYGKNGESVDVSAQDETQAEAEIFYEAGDSPEGEPQADGISDYFATARLTREEARDSAISILEDAAADGASQEVLDQTAIEIMAIAEWSLAETQLENTIIAKGFEDCVVIIDDDSTTVAVSAPVEGLSPTDVAKITDAVISETGMRADQIKIIEVK